MFFDDGCVFSESREITSERWVSFDYDFGGSSEGRFDLFELIFANTNGRSQKAKNDWP